MSEDRRSTFSAWLVVVAVALPSAAAADPLAQAEAAYSRIEFGEAQKLAQAALAGGGYDRAQMIRIYFLLGVSSAAEGKDEEAIDAFKHLLSLDPDTKLDRGLSPKLQGPMLEARGTPPAPLGCDAVFDRAKGSLHLTIRDQLGMAKGVVVRARLLAGDSFIESRAAVAPAVDIPVTGAIGADHLEYSIQLVDDHQNRLLEKGSDAAPELFQLAAVPSAGGGAPAERKLATKWIVVGVIGELLGVAGIAGGAGAYVVGKDAADRWNNDSICLANGMTRVANCSSDRNTAQAAESGAVASFAIGGAFIAASTILLIAAPRTPREQSVASIDCRPGIMSVVCGGRF